MVSENFKFPNRFIDTQFVPYIDKVKIEKLVGSLADLISKDYQGRELIALGVLKGGFSLTADLIRKIRNVRIIVDFIKLSDLGRTRGHDGTIRIEKDLQVDIQGKDVLIIEDIIDSGRALTFIQKRLALSYPRSVKVLTLFDKTLYRKEDVQADYIGKNISEQFIIGYGLDLEGYGRNLEKVYYLKYPN